MSRRYSTETKRDITAGLTQLRAGCKSRGGAIDTADTAVIYLTNNKRTHLPIEWLLSIINSVNPHPMLINFVRTRYES